MGAIAPTQTDETADRAPFVRRVVLPFAAAVAAIDELFPVALEGVVQQGLRQQALLAAGRERDRGRGRVEIAEFGRAGNVIDAVLLRGRCNRAV
ncbi:hypothetical protein D3C71_2034900 [compost metagenome]